MQKRNALPPLIAIDFPRRNEKVSSEHYSLRVATQGEGAVEISLDGGPWEACRPAVGFWWFDWTEYGPGRHEAVARIRAQDGRIWESLPTPFRVEFDQVTMGKEVG